MKVKNWGAKAPLAPPPGSTALGGMQPCCASTEIKLKSNQLTNSICTVYIKCLHELVSCIVSEPDPHTRRSGSGDYLMYCVVRLSPKRFRLCETMPDLPSTHRIQYKEWCYVLTESTVWEDHVFPPDQMYPDIRSLDKLSPLWICGPRTKCPLRIPGQDVPPTLSTRGTF